jgi:hypothetical protein
LASTLVMFEVTKNNTRNVIFILSDNDFRTVDFRNARTSLQVGTAIKIIYYCDITFLKILCLRNTSGNGECSGLTSSIPKLEEYVE